MKKIKKKEIFFLLIVGLVAGTINGFFGAGAGMIVVPTLKLITKMDDKKAHATTLGCVSLMCLSSAVVYMVSGHADYMLFLWCLIGSIVGGVTGTFLLKKLKNKVINLIFSLIVIASGVLMIIL